ncbi:MAG: hypothetical protein HUU29_14715 [Planctomycetaceae bacterium]|nr:hypothetical protein [Planctomycetaceae bacterium]
MLSRETITTLLIIAGAFQFVICAMSLGLPRVLRWKEELARLGSLNRHIFWVYSAYIFGTNLAIALLSTFASAWLLDESKLAAAVSGYIMLYWGARFLIQLFGYRGADIPKGIQYRLVDVAFTFVFAYLGFVYAAALTHNVGSAAL